MELPKDIQHIISTVSNAAQRCGTSAYLSGDYAKLVITDRITPNPKNSIDFILINSSELSIPTFYSYISEKITINSEIKNSEEVYSVISYPYILNFFIRNSICDENQRFSIDNIYYDISKEIVIGNKSEIISDPIVLNYVGIENFGMDDVIDLVLKISNLGKCEIRNLDSLKNIKLSDLKYGLGNSKLDIVVDILLTNNPGTAIKFIESTFKDGKQWMVENLLSSMAALEIPISEDIDLKDIFSDKKIELINIYNEFFLSKNSSYETPEERKLRLATTLKLLFDSPSLVVDIPYIDRISVAISKHLQDGKIQMFEIPGDCEYPPCPTCDPTQCGETGPSCCCCSSVDIVDQVQLECHHKVVISCDSTGTKPGPNDDPFPAGCSRCLESCSGVLGVPGYTDFCSGDLPSWWFLIPPVPCQCECAIPGSPDCNLTCMYCKGDNTRCRSLVSIQPYDCNYVVSLTPGPECCGAPAFINWMFVLDFSGSMSGKIDEIINEIGILTQKLEDTAATANFACTMFGYNIPGSDAIPIVIIEWTSDAKSFTDNLQIQKNKFLGGSIEYDLLAVSKSITEIEWPQASSSFIFLIGDEPTQDPSRIDDRLSGVIQLCNFKNITVHVADIYSEHRQKLVSSTGGQRFNISESFSNIVDSLNLAAFPTSCDCLDLNPIPVYLNTPECECPQDPTGVYCRDHPEVQGLENWSEKCMSIPIEKCTSGETCNCDWPISLFVCGTSIQITPTSVNQVCCGELEGFNCDCPSVTDPRVCCGVDCQPLCDPIEPKSVYNTLSDAQQSIWFNCTQEAAYAIDESCYAFADGKGGFYQKCKDEVYSEIESAFSQCFEGPDIPEGEKVPWTCMAAKCLADESIPDISLDCVSTQHPDVTVLNNGIGIVCYESLDEDKAPVIKIAQFKTSVDYVLLSNREFNFGRLQNNKNWSNGKAKLYYYDDLPIEILQGSSTTEINPDGSEWKDAIGFSSGPLQGQCFPLGKTEIGVPYGEDENGRFLIFITTNSILSSEFPSDDDIYNIKWFLWDVQSAGKKIGDASATGGQNAQSYPYSRFLFDNSGVVNNILSGERVTSHIYNGTAAPVSNPRIVTLCNYTSQPYENSQVLYFTYQALEDNRWKVYLKQLRLSEYKKDDQIIESIQQNTLIKLSSLGITDLIYRIVCVNDKCTDIGESKFLLEKIVTFEVLTTDGREVLNPQFSSTTETWGSLCSGVPEFEFPKRKLFTKFTHSLTTDKCPDEFGFKDLFQNWTAGQEYIVPFTVVSSQSLWNFIKRTSDLAIEPGQYSNLVISGINVNLSTISSIWYENKTDSEWSVISESDLSDMMSYKGMDISEPILISVDESGNCTNPVIKTDSNNDVFIAYEHTDINGLHNIKLVGTCQPVNILPAGIYRGKDIESSLDYFISYADFVYKCDITSTGDGVNQLPDMFIDLNNVIHLAWQSNRDNRWEIYYCNSNSLFAPQRITNHYGKSIKPKISGNKFGYLFIVWQDDRYGNYEILMSYNATQRIKPLYQQDPYLASLRNTGWAHTTDDIQFSITNNLNYPTCYNNIIVKFYNDRFLSDLAFELPASEYPFAFNLKDAQDINSKNLDDISQWNTIENFEFSDTYILDRIEYQSTSKEIDAFIDNSAILSVVIPNLGNGWHLVSINIRASNTAGQSGGWSTNIDISGLSGQTLVLDYLSILGRYQQVKISYYRDINSKNYTLIDYDDDAILENKSSWDNNQPYIKFGMDSVSFDSYLRFKIDIPSGQKIIESSLKFLPYSSQATTVNALIKLLDNNNADSFPDTMIKNMVVSDSRDDAEVHNRFWTSDGDTIGIGYDGYTGDSYDAYFRFPIDIPSNASIISAKLKMRSASDSLGGTNFRISLIDTNDQSEFSSSSRIITPVSSSKSDTWGHNGELTTDQSASKFLYFGNGSGVTYQSYFRFLLNVPKTEIVSNAYLLLTPYTTNSQLCSSIIKLASVKNISEFNETGTAVVNASADANYLWSGWSSPLIGGPAQVVCSGIYNIRFNNIHLPTTPAADYRVYLHFDIPVLLQDKKFVAASIYVNRTTSQYSIPVYNASHDLHPCGSVSDFIPFAINPVIYVSNQIGWAHGDILPLFSENILNEYTFALKSTVADGQNDYINSIDTGFIPYLNIDWATAVPNLMGGVSWSASGWEINVEERSPDISDLINTWLSYQDVGYVGGNYIGLEIGGQASNTELQTCYAWDDGSGKQAQLVVEYGDTVPDVTSMSVLWTPNDEWSLGEDIESVDISSLIQSYISRPGYTASGKYIGLVIKNELSFTKKEIDSYDASYGTGTELEIKYVINTVPETTSNSVIWSPGSWELGVEEESPDISSLVQEFIDRSGYIENNHIGIKIEENGSFGYRDIVAYDDPYLNSVSLDVLYAAPLSWTFTLNSISPPRVCLMDGDTFNGSLSLTPTIRVDQSGSVVSQIPLPIDYETNNAYFIQVVATTDEGNSVEFDQKLSASCLECKHLSQNIWEHDSCSVNILISNTTSQSMSYNFKIKFYSDHNRQKLMYEISSLDNLEYFTVGENVPASEQWGTNGLDLAQGEDFNVTAWPMLDKNNGLLCGIPYYLEVYYCSSLVPDYHLLSIQDWMCECRSERWTWMPDHSVKPLGETARWQCSGEGLSDIRLTESISNNLNPSIIVRNDYTGIILYESNRPKIFSPNNTIDYEYKIYCSVFSVSPNRHMYASSVRSILSSFSYLIYKSDVELCPGLPSECYDSNGNRRVIYGNNVSASVDQFDNLFVAIEKHEEPSECDMFTKGKEKHIIVHRCGILTSEFLFDDFIEEKPQKQTCSSDNILKKIYTVDDAVFNKTIKLIRVKSEFVKYHITYAKENCAVVNQCNIEFEVIGAPESSAIQLKNSDSDVWSSWMPFSPTIGENSLNIKWSLSAGSGIKQIQFQVATVAGVTGTTSLNIIADYDPISYSVVFYGASEIAPDTMTNEEIVSTIINKGDLWKQENRLTNFNDIPVASVGVTVESVWIDEYGNEVPEGQGTEVFRPIELSSTYALIEIIPDIKYVSQFNSISDDIKSQGSGEGCIAPTFDFIHQGSQSYYNQKTWWSRNSDNQEVFRSYIQINKDDDWGYKDGLATIRPHFKNDCSDSGSVSGICSGNTTVFSRNEINQLTTEKTSSQNPSDIWSENRNNVGLIQYPIVIRPVGDDPYLIFGDPNYYDPN